MRADIAAFVRARVRWGGTIVGIENLATETRLDVVARPLRADGRPDLTGDSMGRFVARIEGFRDPAIYRPGREITVAGVVRGEQVRPVGEYRYRYVVIDANVVKLWPPEPPRYLRYPSSYYDPFYDPFWPNPWFGPYPFWR